MLLFVALVQVWSFCWMCACHFI